MDETAHVLETSKRAEIILAVAVSLRPEGKIVKRFQMRG
jgi:hypothetical protein